MDLHDYKDMAENYDRYLDVMYAHDDHHGKRGACWPRCAALRCWIYTGAITAIKKTQTIFPPRPNTGAA